MLANRFLLETHGIVLATAEVDGIHYLLHVPRTTSPGWVVGLDDEGLRHGVPLHSRPTGDEEILGTLREIAARPPTQIDKAWRVLEARVISTQGVVRPLLTVIGDNRVLPGRLKVENHESRERHQRTLLEIDSVQASFMERFGKDRLSLTVRVDQGLRVEIQNGVYPAGVPLRAPWPIRATRKQISAGAGILAKGGMEHPVIWGEAGHFEGPPEAIRGRLLENLGLAPSTVSRMSGWEKPISPAVVAALKAIPADWVPTDRKEVDAFHLVAEALDSRIRMDGDLKTLLSVAKGRWVEFAERLSRASGKPERFDRNQSWLLKRHLSNSTQDAVDLVDGFSEALPRTVGNEPPAPEARALAWEALTGARGLPALLEASVEWHARFVPARAADPELSWKPGLPGWKDDATGVEVIPLTSGAELEAEGSASDDGLDHCVGSGSYAAKCARGVSRIVSLRLEGKRLSTAEIAMETGKVVQHRGRGNSEPTQEAVLTLDAYLDLPSTREAIVRGVRAVDLSQSYDPEWFEPILDTWRPYLCGQWRHASSRDFIERLGVETEPPGFRP